MDLEEVGYEGMDWIHLAQNKDGLQVFVNAVMNLRVSKRQGLRAGWLLKKDFAPSSESVNNTVGNFTHSLYCSHHSYSQS
jgi:hypothetical protein